MSRKKRQNFSRYSLLVALQVRYVYFITCSSGDMYVLTNFDARRQIDLELSQ